MKRAISPVPAKGEVFFALVFTFSFIAVFTGVFWAFMTYVGLGMLVLVLKIFEYRERQKFLRNGEKARLKLAIMEIERERRLSK